MDVKEYRAWRERLNAWLVDNPAAEAPAEAPTDGTDPLGRRIFDVLHQCRRIAEGVNATSSAAKVEDRNPYDKLLPFLDKILTMDDWSLAEYVYVLPGFKNPGLRLTFEGPVEDRRITFVFFEEFAPFRRAGSGGAAYELLYLHLSGETIRPVPPEGSAGYYSEAGEWRGFTAEALCLPVRLLLVEEPAGPDVDVT